MATNPRSRQRSGIPPPQFAGTLLEWADRAASYEKLTIDEKEKLQTWREQLKMSVDDLMKILTAHNELQMGSINMQEPFDPGGAMHLEIALSATYMISSLAVENPIQDRLWREAIRNTAPATKAKKKKSEKIDEIIIRVCLPSFMKRPDLSNNRLANIHLDEINTLLAPYNWSLDLDAVRKRIKVLRTNGRLSG